jgi:hypothetical protein
MSTAEMANAASTDESAADATEAAEATEAEATTRIAGLRPLTKRERLREMVADALRAAVISGEMKPGAVYSAPTLGTMFGISATPVREAMLDLVREGMVEALPNKGYRVRVVPEEELDEITHVRVLLEPPTVRDVVPLVPERDFPRLRELADAIVEAVRDRDLAWLEKHLGEEFTLTTGRPGAPVRSRSEWLEITRDRYVIEEFAFEELEPLVYGGVAVVRSRYRQRGSMDGADRTQTFLLTDVWADRGGRVQLVTRHSSALEGA